MRKFFIKILCRLFPELRVLRDPSYDFKRLRTWQRNVKCGCDVRIDTVSSLENVEIGNHSYIGYNSQVSDTKIGNFCSIGPNFFCGWGIHPTNGISTSPHIYSTSPEWTVAEQTLVQEHGEIHIGNDVFIGANVTILEGVAIGDGAVIGAGAVVTKDIPAYAIAVGVPAKVVKYRMSPTQIDAMNRIAWWNWDDSKIKEVNKYFFDVDEFIRKYED